MSRFELDGTFTQDQIPDIRRFVERLHRWIPDRDLHSRIAMATHELFENAVKFASDKLVQLSIDVERGGTIFIRITTKNRARPSDLKELAEMRARLHEASDMMTFYIEMMRRSPMNKAGGLGLGRVAAEAEMKLDLLLELDVVTINAELEVAA